MQYYITSKRTSEVGYWDKAKATTLIGAKLEATRIYGKGFRDAVLMVGVGYNVTEERIVIASRLRISHNWWTAPGNWDRYGGDYVPATKSDLANIVTEIVEEK